MTLPDDKPSVHEQKYFADQDKELIRRLRAQLDAERAAQTPTASLRCPKCGGTLVEEERGAVKIDRCSACDGIWLDAGELELLSQSSPQGARGFLDALFRRGG